MKLCETKDIAKRKLRESQILKIPEKKGGKASNYEDRTKDELYEQAKKVGIEGRSNMTKEELIEALRNH